MNWSILVERSKSYSKYRLVCFYQFPFVFADTLLVNELINNDTW